MSWGCTDEKDQTFEGAGYFTDTVFDSKFSKAEILAWLTFFLTLIMFFNRGK